MTQQTSGIKFSLRDLFRVVFRQKWRALLTSAAILGVTAAAIVLAPRKYQSEARVFLRVGRESVTLDPTASAGQPAVQSRPERDHEIRSAIETIRSRVILEAAAARIGAERVLQQRIEGEIEPQPSWVRNVTDSATTVMGRARQMVGEEDVSDHEKAVRKLATWLIVGAEKDSSVISIVCRCGSARLAQRVVQEVLDEYKHQHIRMHRTTGSREFFEEQIARVDGDLDSASNRLRDAKNATGVASIETQQTIIRQQIDNLNLEIARTDASLASDLAKIDVLQRQNPDITLPTSADGQPREEIAAGFTERALDSMRETLYELQLRDQEMASMYLENHPDRRSLQRQLAEAQRIMSRQELVLAHSNASEYRAQLASLKRKFADAEQQLIELNENEVQLAEFENEVARLKTAHRQYVESMETATIDEALGQKRISNVNVLQDPSLENKPVSPKRMLMAILGLIGAVFGGLGAAVASEYMDPTLKTPDEVESELDLPVLVSIPHASRHRLSVN